MAVYAMLLSLSVLAGSSARELKQHDTTLLGWGTDDGTAADPAGSTNAGAIPFLAEGLDWAANNKLYLYNWCGLAPNNDKGAKDFVATMDATPGSATFGQVVHVADSPFKGTQPHHCNVDRTGKWLATGGLVSFLYGDTVPDIMLFNTSNPAAPVYSHGIVAKMAGCTDEFLQLPAGEVNGFAVTNMCNRTGHPGGNVAILKGRKMKTLLEYPGGLPTADASRTFDPHGIDLDVTNDRMVTCDFINIASTLDPPPAPYSGPIFQTTLRVWKYKSKKILKTIDLGTERANGLMDVRKVPSKDSTESLFWATNGYGQWLLVDAKKLTVADDFAYCLSDTCAKVAGACINSNTFADGTRMLISTYALNEVRLLDISNPRKLVELDRWRTKAGGHVVKFHAPTRIAAISTYFVDQAGTVVRFKADNKVSLLQIISAKGGSFNKIQKLAEVDFDTALPDKGVSNCHGLAFNVGPNNAD